MTRLTMFVACCGLLVADTCVLAAPSADVIKAAKWATACVLDNDQPIATAFCISGEGYFLTSLPAAEVNKKYRLVIEPDEKS